MTTLFLIIIYLSFISLGLPDSMLGSAWPVMWSDIGASFGSAGIISMTIAGGTIVSSLMSGRVIQKLGTGKVTLISCCLTAGALLGISFSPSLVWLIVLAIPLGIGAGAVDSALNNYVAENYKAHHMNWLHCFWGIGATTGPIIMSYYIAEHNSWRGGYTTVAIIQWVLVIILLVTLPLWKKVATKHKKESSEDGLPANADEAISSHANSNRKIINIPGVKPTLIAFLFYCGAESTVGLWGASYLVGAKNLTAETAAGWVSLYYGGITVGRMITGFISLKVPNRILIRCGQLIAIAGGIVLLLPLPAVISLIGYILVGLGLAPIFPGLLHETPARFGNENSAKLMGYQMATAYVGSTFLAPVFGVIASNISINLFPLVVFIYLMSIWLASEKVTLSLRKRK
ncbi:MAG: MFS transporter [Mobilitalea sp.]